MTEKIKKIQNKEFWLAFIAVFSFYILALGQSIYESNTTYALEQINKFDSRIFANNYAVCNNGLSARFFMNQLVSSLMFFTRGNWNAVSVPLVYFGTAVLALATVEIVFNLSKKNRLILALILAVFLRKGVNTGFAGWNSFRQTTIGYGTAYSFTMLAFSQIVGKEKKWNTCWILLSAATLFHVHEGLWGFCFFIIIFICQSVSEKSFHFHWAFVVFFMVLGFCVIPGLFGETAGITSEEFVAIYAKYRLSHHLVPSSWGIKSIIKYLSVLIGGAIMRIQTLRYCKKKEIGTFILESSLAIGSWIAALAFTYVFTEVLPIAAITTMYVPKYFKYVGILSLIWCIQTVIDWLERDEFFVALACAVTVFVASKRGIKGLFVVYFVFFIGLYVWETDFFQKARSLLCFKPVKIYEHINKIVHNTFLIILVSLLMLGYATKDRVWSFDTGFVTPDSYSVRSMGQELYDLAIEFNKKTEPETVFISEPKNANVHWFQFASERNSYVNYKNVPGTQKQIKEWYDRMQETRNLFLKRTDEIVSIMDNHGIDYILVDDENFNKLQSSESFAIMLKSENDKYRIYHLI